ncbi:hypothetical protein C8R46DRAFT_1053529 [Mycena filopes]|nr:hypothetical protein C8R46DRAFT_1053529 [Mycena filopes]
MSWHTEKIEGLCHDRKTADEAIKIYQIARAHTAAGSGFDLKEATTALPAVCALLASERLNNTNVTLEAARIASCQNKPKFHKLYEHVKKALAAPKAAWQKPLDFQDLLIKHCPEISQYAVKVMDKVQDQVDVKLDDEDGSYESITDNEVKCAVFAWVCNLLRERRFQSKPLEERYETNAANMRVLNAVIKSVCPEDQEAKFREDYARVVASTKSASVSPRKSPIKPLRTLPSSDSPQKRKAAFPAAEEDSKSADSPTKRQKVTEAAASSSSHPMRSLRSTTSSPTKPSPVPSTPRKAQRLLSSPSKSPSKAAIPFGSKLFAVDAQDASSDEEEQEPPPRRRFRPVFRDHEQWAMCDPRLAKITATAAEFNKLMIGLHGRPFEDPRHDRDTVMDD